MTTTSPVLAAALAWAAARGDVRSGAEPSDTVDRASDRLEAAVCAWQQALAPQPAPTEPAVWLIWKDGGLQIEPALELQTDTIARQTASRRLLIRRQGNATWNAAIESAAAAACPGCRNAWPAETRMIQWQRGEAVQTIHRSIEGESIGCIAVAILALRREDAGNA